MSACVITTDTIDVIVSAAIKFNVITAHSANVVGQAILDQNIRSVNVRYPDTITGGNLPGSTAMLEGYVPVTIGSAGQRIAQTPRYTFNPFPRKLRRAAIHGAIQCWFYQCADDAAFSATSIFNLIDMVRERNLNRILIANPDWSADDEEVTYWDVSERDAVMLRVRQPVVSAVPEPEDEDELDSLPEGDEDEDDDEDYDDDLDADDDR